MTDKTTRFGISLSSELLRQFDKHIARHHYTNRSEAIRDLIRQTLVEEEWSESEHEVMGTVTLVFDHHIHDLSKRLTNIQHDFAERIVSTTHVHLDHDNCLEVLIVRGPGREIGDLASRIKCIRGVKHATLSMTTTGRSLD
ncbi:MAG: nickel-responsive transcriptional regulator NikR [Candidatus Sumerlaeota bacterium]